MRAARRPFRATRLSSLNQPTNTDDLGPAAPLSLTRRLGRGGIFRGTQTAVRGRFPPAFQTDHGEPKRSDRDDERPAYARFSPKPLTDSNRRPLLTMELRHTGGSCSASSHVVIFLGDERSTHLLRPRTTTRVDELRSHIGHTRLGSPRPDRLSRVKRLGSGIGGNRSECFQAFSLDEVA
jgi:hypothetical protein